MIYLHSDHIITPLGEGCEANLSAIVQGDCRLRMHESVHDEALMTPVMASLLDMSSYQIAGYTLFESLCIRAVEGALRQEATPVDGDECVFIVSSTKGDIWCSMFDSAQHIAQYFGNHVAPIVVSTACTSGVSAQFVAQRLLESGTYEKAVVVGCDVQCKFIISGFQCFKALSEERCAPFDKDRSGLNAGEAAACMILSRSCSGLGWQLLGGSVHNDANHISGPSRTAEGSLRCLQDMLGYVTERELAVVSVHGTGTAYNDEMESIALYRAGLTDVPVTALKGVYGHTMGAAGLLETILSLHALADGQILPTPGYREQGTTYAVNVSKDVRSTNKRVLVKMLSGFGGVNAAVAWNVSKTQPVQDDAAKTASSGWETVAEVRLDASTDLVALYREKVGDWPKFFKMDQLSRLGFVAVELLLQKVKAFCPDMELDTEHCDLILGNRSASLKNDTDYQATIEDPDNYYPSPALFVYTLPNIVTGEIAIRHHLMGATLCYILDSEEQLYPLAEATLAENATQAIIGWVECSDSTHYCANVAFKVKC